MSRRAVCRFALVLGLLALVVGGVFLLARTRNMGGTGEAIPRDEAETADEPAHLAGRPSGEAPGETFGMPATANHASGEAAAGAVRVELPVRVETDRADAAVLMFAFGPTRFADSEEGEYVRAKRSGPGPFRLDVTDIVRQILDRGPRPEIVLKVFSPGHVGVRVHVALPLPEDLLAGRAHLDPVTLVLRPVATVSGHVFGPDGHPRWGATVLLYPMTPEGPEPNPVAEWVSDKEGAFTLAAAWTGRHLLVASWHDCVVETEETTERPLPASVVVDLEVGRDLGDLELRLRASQVIRGTVRVNGKAVRFATVDWRPAGNAYPLRDRWDDRFGTDPDLYLLDGCVHWGRDPVSTDHQGRFEILGPSAITYRIHVDDVVGAHLHHMSKEKAEVEVTPPAGDLVFDLRLGKLVLLVRFDGQPVLLEDQVHLTDRGMHPELGDDVCWGTWFGETDATGRIEVGLTPAHRYGVVVQEPGYEQWWKEFDAPLAGETLTLDIDLVRERPKPRVVVVLEGEGVETLKKASFGFYSPDVDPMSRTPWPLRSAKPEDRRYVLEGLIAGPYRLHVRPGRDWFDVPGDWLETEVDVEIPASGEVEVTVPVKRGGRLLIEATDVDGRYLECPCTLRNPSGEALQTYFFVRRERGGGIYSHDLPGSGPVWVDRTLPAGTYEITLEPEGYAREVRTVEIQQGRPTTLRVTLRRP